MRGAPAVVGRFGGSTAIRMVHRCLFGHRCPSCLTSASRPCMRATCSSSPIVTPATAAPAPHSNGLEQRKHNRYMGARGMFSYVPPVTNMILPDRSGISVSALKDLTPKPNIVYRPSGELLLGKDSNRKYGCILRERETHCDCWWTMNVD